MDFMDILLELKTGVEKAAEEQGGTDVLIKNVIANITGQTQEIQKVKKTSIADYWGERVCCIKQYKKLKRMNNSKEESVSEKPKKEKSEPKPKNPKTEKSEPKPKNPESDESKIFENPLSPDNDDFLGGGDLGEGKGGKETMKEIKNRIKGYVIIHFIVAVGVIGFVTWVFTNLQDLTEKKLEDYTEEQREEINNSKIDLFVGKVSGEELIYLIGASFIFYLLSKPYKGVKKGLEFIKDNTDTSMRITYGASLFFYYSLSLLGGPFTLAEKVIFNSGLKTKIFIFLICTILFSRFILSILIFSSPSLCDDSGSVAIL